MKLYKAKMLSLIVILYLLFFPFIAIAQGIKTTVGDILSDPDKYDGKMVEVKGMIEYFKI